MQFLPTMADYGGVAQREDELVGYTPTKVLRRVTGTQNKVLPHEWQSKNLIFSLTWGCSAAGGRTGRLHTPENSPPNEWQ